MSSGGFGGREVPMTGEDLILALNKFIQSGDKYFFVIILAYFAHSMYSYNMRRQIFYIS